MHEMHQVHVRWLRERRERVCCAPERKELLSVRSAQIFGVAGIDQTHIYITVRTDQYYGREETAPNLIVVVNTASLFEKKGFFEPRRRLKLSGRHILLFFDCYTTTLYLYSTLRFPNTEMLL